MARLGGKGKLRALPGAKARGVDLLTNCEVFPCPGRKLGEIFLPIIIAFLGKAKGAIVTPLGNLRS
jgi:hypothetical protein